MSYFDNWFHFSAALVSGVSLARLHYTNIHYDRYRLNYQLEASFNDKLDASQIWSKLFRISRYLCTSSMIIISLFTRPPILSFFHILMSYILSSNTT